MNDLITRLLLNASNFNDNLSASTRQVQQFQQRMNTMGNVMSGVFTKVLPMIGAATTAYEAFNKIINSTQSSQDAFNRIIDQGKGAVDSFFTSIANGNLSNLIDDLKTATKEAGNLYNALDSLGSLEIRSNFAISMLEAQRDIYQLKVKDVSLSKEEREEAQKLLDLTNQRINALRGNLGNTQIATGTEGLNSIVRTNASAVNQYGFREETKRILQGLVKNIEGESFDYLQYAEKPQESLQAAKDYISEYEKNMEIAGKKMAYYRNRSHAEYEKYQNLQKDLTLRFKQNFANFPDHLIALILEQVDDGENSDMQKFFNMVAEGSKALTENQRALSDQHKANRTLTDSTNRLVDATEKAANKIDESANKFDSNINNVKIFDFKNNSFSPLSDDLVNELKKLPKEIKAQLEPKIDKFIDKQNYLAEQYRLGNITIDTFKSDSSKLQGDLLNNLVEFATSGDILQYNKKAVNESRLPTGLNRIISILSTQQGQNKTDANNAAEAKRRYEDVKIKHQSLQYSTADLSSTTYTDVLGNEHNKTIAELEGQIAAINNVVQELLKVRKEYGNIIKSNLISDGDDISYLLDGILNCNTTIEVLNNSLENTKAKLKELKETADMGEVGNSIAIMGNALSGVFREAGNEGAAFFMQMIGQIGALIAQLANMAITAGVASAAKLPYPYNIGAVASVVATIGGILSSAMQTFADGGIVQGGSYSGDKTLIRVNAGEMVLNHGQQANLFRMLNDGTTPKTNAVSGDVHFRIQGKDLVGVLGNYNNKMSKLR